MLIVFHLGHPAHFHLFKNTIKSLDGRGHEFSILIKKKDILEDLLIDSGLKYYNILPKGRKDTKFGILLGLIKQDSALFLYCLKNRPDLLVGTSVSISHVGKILKIPVLNINEDDAEVVPLYAKLGYPWSTYIIAPDCCSVGKWANKKIGYPGYHELAYLHPDTFVPNKDIVGKYFSTLDNYFIIRFAKLTAHHDKGVRGIDYELAHRIIDTLKPHGRVFITSERPLEEGLEPYRISIDPSDMHHILAFAQLYIGDSQTMAAEAGVLGTPFIRINDFVGKIGYLGELEEKYKLGYGFKPNNHCLIISQIREIINMKDRKTLFQQRRDKMLSEKINYSKFLTWFIDGYPKSADDIKNNPNIIRRFL
jgi:predicted glycosyltransferase